LFKANPLKLFKEINIGCTTKGTYKLDKIQARRVVTIPADVNKNNAAALDAVFLSKVRLPQRVNKYKVLPRFFNSVDLLEASARVGGAAAVAREALLRVIGSGDYESTTSMLSKGVQYTL
jgi:butyrate kinase